MIVVRTLHGLENAKAEYNGKMAFVPTMGALHAGHLSLVSLAQEKADFVAVSIFVNPTQFAPNEDFDSYPRDEAEDLKKLDDSGVDIVFLPTEELLYPDGHATNITAGEAAKGLETDFRPHFFDGVVNVVHRLFEAVKPDIAIFGKKDFQQLQVIAEMVENLGMPIEIIGAEIARDEYGLALSSRNAYLSDEELKIARTLNVVLRDAAKSGDFEAAKARLLENGFDKIDYVDGRWDRILGAAWLGKTRLIDNVNNKIKAQ